MNKQVLLIKGDGIGPEVLEQAHAVLETVNQKFSLGLSYDTALLGGEAYDATGEPLPQETLDKAKNSQAVLFGALGGPQWDALPAAKRPEKGLLMFRSAMGLFGNLRPAILYPQLADASSLKKELVAGLDLMIVRELTGGIYFGEPRGIVDLGNGKREGFNTDRYNTDEIERIGRVAFEIAQKRNKKLCSIDKANVMEVTVLWRETMEELSKEYPDVELSHMYVDNAAMQLVREPKQFDVMVTGNIFGDILSDEAAMLTGSIGMLPSASLNESGFGMYEPCHGSAPDIAGQGIANPLATILSAAMMLKYTFGEIEAGNAIEQAVGDVLDSGLRTADIATEGDDVASTAEMGAAVIAALQ